MATTATSNEATTNESTIREVNGTNDKIEKENHNPLTHTATNITLSPELFEKVRFFGKDLVQLW